VPDTGPRHRNPYESRGVVGFGERARPRASRTALYSAIGAAVDAPAARPSRCADSRAPVAPRGQPRARRAARTAARAREPCGASSAWPSVFDSPVSAPPLAGSEGPGPLFKKQKHSFKPPPRPLKAVKSCAGSLGGTVGRVFTLHASQVMIWRFRTGSFSHATARTDRSRRPRTEWRVRRAPRWPIRSEEAQYRPISRLWRPLAIRSTCEPQALCRPRRGWPSRTRYGSYRPRTAAAD